MSKKETEGFDVMYKSSPNFSDKNRIKAGYEEGKTAEEIAREVRVKVKSVATYAPKPSPKASAKGS